MGRVRGDGMQRLGFSSSEKWVRCMGCSRWRRSRFHSPVRVDRRGRAPPSGGGTRGVAIATACRTSVARRGIHWEPPPAVWNAFWAYTLTFPVRFHADEMSPALQQWGQQRKYAKICASWKEVRGASEGDRWGASTRMLLGHLRGKLLTHTSRRPPWADTPPRPPSAPAPSSSSPENCHY